MLSIAPENCEIIRRNIEDVLAFHTELDLRLREIGSALNWQEAYEEHGSEADDLIVAAIQRTAELFAQNVCLNIFQSLRVSS